MFSGIHILDSCLRAWGKGKHLELNAEHMLKLLIRNKKKQCIILSEDSKPLLQNLFKDFWFTIKLCGSLETRCYIYCGIGFYLQFGLLKVIPLESGFIQVSCRQHLCFNKPQKFWKKVIR